MTLIDGEKRTLKIEYENKISDVKHQLRSLKIEGRLIFGVKRNALAIQHCA